MRLGGLATEPHAKSASASIAGAPSATASTSASRPLSPIELIQEKQPTTNAQKIALFAYYREKVEGLSRFSRDDLAGYFAKARQPPPGNFHRDFQVAVNLGWIYEDGDDSYLTTKGLEAVEAGFAGKAQPRGRSATGSKKRGNRGKRTAKTSQAKRKQKRS